MKARDLMRLSECSGIPLTDGIYNYTLSKKMSKPDDLIPESRMFYYIRYERGKSIQLSEWEEPYFEDYQDGPQRKYLSAMVSVGGMYVHTDNIYTMIQKLRFVPRGSFAELVKLTKNK